MPHDLPAVPNNSSQAAEVVKQIIEQILINERRRARIEFVQISGFFLVFLFVILGAGIWFARQLLVQLRDERQLTEQTWRMMAGQNDGSLPVYPAAKPVPPALNREEVAKLEQNVNDLSDLLKNKPQNASASVRDKLQSQQNAIQSMSARLNESQPAAVPGGGDSGVVITAPLAKDLNLRLPMP